MRRTLALIAAVASVALALAAPAGAAKLVTWTTTSRYVDPAHVNFNGVPANAPFPPSRLPVNVLLPDGYTRSHCYPVLYLLHGHGDSYWSWIDPSDGDLMQIAKGFPGIVVMPEGDRGWYTNWWNGGKRGDPAWEDYYLKELIPLVERRLPICRGRRWHAIAGLSMGGEGAIYLASQRPDYFGSAASFSGVLSIQRPEWPTGFDTQGEKHQDVYGDPDAQRFYWTGHNPTALVQNLRYTRVFVTVGDGVNDMLPTDATDYFGSIAEVDLRQHAQDFVSAAQMAGVDVTYHPRHGIHDWPWWRRGLADALSTWGFFGKVQKKPPTWSFTTVATKSQAWGFSFTFSAPPGAVETFRRDGDTLHGTGAGTVAVRTPCGARFTAKMPFDRVLKCVHKRHRHHASHRHHARGRAAPRFTG